MRPDHVLATALVALCALVALGVGATANAASAAGAPDNLPPNTTARARGDGWVFADARGMTLYTFDRDEAAPGKSQCNGECAVQWPPHAAEAGAQGRGDWSVISRDDGSLQWAYRGRPLYRYTPDASPGSTFGDGAETVWHVAFKPIPTPREIGIGETVLGSVLTDNRGRTLYTSSADCRRDCLKDWEPVAAPALANAFGDFSVVTRDTGLKQWAYKGQALYRRPATDIKPGEVSGQGQRGFAVTVLEPPPPLPPWATIQPSDAGELIANDKGLTVYAHGTNARGRRRLTVRPPGCDVDDCVDAQWQPFIAAPDARPIGSWSLVKLPDGRQQWSYKGQKVYTNVLDRKPGDFKGIRFGGDRSWSAIMRNGQPMQGVSVGG
jgi:predicted lipoprotein with Yx(FWY)xxD motif